MARMAASLPEHPREAAMDARPTTSALLAWLLAWEDLAEMGWLPEA